jgi:hypothetical protein
MPNKKIVSLIFCLFLTVSLNACSPAEEKPTDNTHTTTEKPAADMETKSTEKTEETTSSAEEEVDVDEDAFEEEDVADEQESLKTAAGWTPEIEKGLAKTFSDACSADANMGKALEMVKKADKKAEFCGCFGEKNVEGWKAVFPDLKTLHATSKEDAKKMLSEKKVGENAAVACGKSVLGVNFK